MELIDIYLSYLHLKVAGKNYINTLYGLGLVSYKEADLLYDWTIL